MNSFIKNNKQIFSLVFGISLSSSLGAVTIYDKPLASILQPDQSLTITFREEDDCLMLNMQDGKFDPRSGSINVLENLNQVFQRVFDNKDGSWDRNNCNISCDSLNANFSHFIGRESMDIEEKTSLKLRNCLLESPFISIRSNTINFDNCFLINPRVLNIVGDGQKSDYKIIQIIFREQPVNPTIITGEIDLKNNRTTKQLIITNVKQIKVQFNPRAWNNNWLTKEQKNMLVYMISASVVVLFFSAVTFVRLASINII